MKARMIQPNTGEEYMLQSTELEDLETLWVTLYLAYTSNDDESTL